MNLSKGNLAIIEAFQKGYKIENGEVINHLHKKINFILSKKGYPIISVSIWNTRYPVKVHRLAAYQKFGNAIFEKEMQVRHLNGNKLDFSFQNIEIGTSKQNQLDKPIEKRKHAGYLSALRKRKLSIEQATEIRNEYLLLTKKRGFINMTARKYNVHKTLIHNIVHFKSYLK
jgi:hypothetical protein